MKTAFISALTICTLLTGCQSTSGNQANAPVENVLQVPSPVAETTDKSKAIEQSNSARQVARFTPPVGTSVVWQDSKGKRYSTSVLAHNVQFGGQNTIKYGRRNGITYALMSNGNRIAFTRLNGRTIRIWKPDTGRLKFPLFVGKKWSNSYVFERKDRPFSKSWSFTAEVEGWETLNLPIGEIETLRIRRNWSGSGGISYHWYAPKLGFMVKAKFSNSRRSGGGQLISHKLP